MVVTFALLPKYHNGLIIVGNFSHNLIRSAVLVSIANLLNPLNFVCNLQDLVIFTE